MKSRQVIGLCAAILGLYVRVPGAQAQAQGTGPIGPVGDIRQLPVPGARDLALEPSPLDSRQPQAQADTHTLSSIEMLGVGSLGVVRSFLDPSFHFSQTVDTGIIPGARDSATSMGMNLTFNRHGNRSTLTGSYNGAHVFYYPNSLYNNTYHNLAVSEEIRWARWVLRLRNDLLISPETSFGASEGGGTTVQQFSTTVNDTILTQRAKRLNDTAAVELDYFLSRRSTMTFAGSYITLHFTDPGFINSHGVTGRIGYDYAIAPKDFIGLIYNHTHTAFSAGAPALETDAVQLAYGRKVTGRLAFQVSAGPQLQRSGSIQILNWGLSTAATYQTRRTQYAFSYMYGTSAGSGVLAGSQNQTVAGSVRYALSRLWSASFGGGYAFNQALTPVKGISDSFGNWYGTASVAREIGRHLQFSVDYRYQQQAAGTGLCPISACGSTQSRQVLGIAVEWHPWSLPR
jgi:hypothetical protein